MKTPSHPWRAWLASLTILALTSCAIRPLDPPAADAGDAPMDRYAAFALRTCDRTEAQLPQLTSLAERVAERHLAGGMLGVVWEPPAATGPQGPQYEIKGRSGGLSAYDGSAAKRMAQADRAKDTVIIGWQRDPDPRDLDILRKYREHYFVVAFGPRSLPALAEHVKLCDAWIDTGLEVDDRVVELPAGTRAGRGQALANILNAWVFQAELVAALTRHGKMPTMLKSHAWDDSAEWNGRYRGKMRFHDDLEIRPVAAGVLGQRYLDRIRGLVRTFTATQRAPVARTADLIAEELRHGHKTVVAQTGHTTYELVGKYEDEAWASPVVLYATAGRIKQYPELTAEAALVLRLGYSGLDAKLANLMRGKRQRIMLITSAHDIRPDFQVPPDLETVIDTGWDFGDACVRIEGYPIRVFPPSGVMQIVAYEAVNVEVLSRLAQRAP